MTTMNNEQCNAILCSILASALNKVCAASKDNTWKVSVAADATPSDDNPTVRDYIVISGELTGTFEYETAQADLDRIGALITSKDPRDLANALRDELVFVLSKRYRNIKAEVKAAEKLQPANSKSITLSATQPGAAAINFSIAMSSTIYDVLAIAAQSTQPAPNAVPSKLNLVMDVELNVMLRFGQREMALSDILDLKMGSVVELDRKVEEPVELLLDGTVFARGEAVIIDGNYGLRITEVVQPMASQFVN